MLTYREARYIAHRIAGLDKTHAIRKAGLPEYMVKASKRELENGEVLATLERMQRELVEHTLEVGLADAKELHEYLTDQLRADIADLYDENDELKPVKDWPAWARNGGVEILDTPNMVPSRDETGASWDQVGRKKTVRIAPRHKTVENLMKHKAVDALQQPKAGDTNIVVVTAERARRVNAALKRLRQYEGDVINV